MEALLTLQIFAGMLVLLAASGLFIHSLVHIGRIARIREHMIVFVLVGFAPAFPELFIGINAVILKVQPIALGNAIGTSIASMAFIAGMVAIFSKKFSTRTFFAHHDLTSLSLSTVLLFILASDGELSRIDGALLLIVFGYYLWNLYEQRHEFKIRYPESKKNLFVHLLVLIITAISIYLAAQYVLLSVYFLQSETMISGFLVGIILLAPLGALPELIIEFELIRGKLSSLSFGDLFTSVVVNSTLVIGVVSLLRPFTIESPALVQFSGFFLLILLLLFNVFARTRKQIDWKEGLVLVLGYFVFII